MSTIAYSFNSIARAPKGTNSPNARHSWLFALLASALTAAVIIAFLPGISNMEAGASPAEVVGPIIAAPVTVVPQTTAAAAEAPAPAPAIIESEATGMDSSQIYESEFVVSDGMIAGIPDYLDWSVLEPGSVTPAAVEETAAVPVVTGQILVKFKPDVTTARIDEILSSESATIVDTIETLNVLEILLPAGSNIDEALYRLRNLPEVEYAEPNSSYSAPESPDDITPLPEPGGSTTPTTERVPAVVADGATEVVEKRTECSEFFINPDGTLVERIFAAPIHYQDETGVWQKIDNNLVSVQESEGAGSEHQEPVTEHQEPVKYVNTGGAVGTEFSGDGSDANLVSVTKGDYELTTGDFKMITDEGEVSAEAVEPIITAAPSTGGLEEPATEPLPLSSIVYQDIMDGVDLKYTVNNQGIKEEIVLDKAPIGNKFSFALNMQNLVYEKTAAGLIIFKDSATGTEVFRLPKAFMVDSRVPLSEADYSVGSVSTDIVSDASGLSLLMTLDPTWLYDPARIFPIIVDPQETWGPSRDWYWSPTNGSVDDNYGNPDEYDPTNKLRVGYYSDVWNNCTSYIRFDSAQGMTVNSATFYTYCYHSYWDYSWQPIWVGKLTQDAWSGAPAYENRRTMGFLIDNDCGVDVTDIVKESYPWGFGIVLNSGGSCDQSFYGKFADSTWDMPYVVISFNAPPTTTAVSPAGDSILKANQPLLKWTYADTEGTAISNATIEIASDPNFTGTIVWAKQVGATTAYLMKATEGLPDGKYYWRAYVCDGHNLWSNPSNVASFIINAAYNASYQNGLTSVLPANTTINVPIAVKNTGTKTWNATGANPFALSYSFTDQGNHEGYDSRVWLPYDVPANQTVYLTAPVKTPGSYDDFSTAPIGWTASNGTWAVENGELSQSNTGADGRYICANTFSTDQTVNVKAKTLSAINGAESNILFRYRDANNFYQAMLWYRNDAVPSGVYLYKNLGGVWSQLGQYATPISMNTFYMLKVETVGSEIKVYLNDVLRLSVVDSSIASGSVGLRSSSTHSHFDDFKVVTKNTLKWDMVQEGVTWFSSKAVPVLAQAVSTTYDTNASFALQTDIAKVVQPNAAIAVPIRATNLGLTVWKGANPQTRLAGRWYTQSGTMVGPVVYAEMPVGSLVSRGDYMDFNLLATTPDVPGVYMLRIDMVTGSGFFSDSGTPTLDVVVAVQPLGSQSFWPQAGPVNLFSGNLSLSVADVNIQGRGPDVSVSRTYNSQSPNTGVLGRGWTLSTETNLSLRPDGTVLLTGPDGSTQAFYWNPAGYYVNPPGVYLDLKREWTSSSVITQTSLTDFSAGTVDSSALIRTTNGDIVYVPSKTTNIALAANGATATQSSYRNPGEEGSKAIDGNRTTIWCAGGSTPQWVQISFPGAKNINKIVVYNHGNPPFTPKDYLIQTYNGSSWVTQKTVTGNVSFYPTGLEYYFAPTQATAVRVYVTASGAAYYTPVINEVEVFEANPTEAVFVSSVIDVGNADLQTLSWTRADSLLKGGGFESLSGGPWSQTSGFGFTPFANWVGYFHTAATASYSLDTTVKHSGTASLKLTSGASTADTDFRTISYDLAPGSYILSGWVKTENLNPGASTNAGGLSLCGALWDTTNGVTNRITGTTDWTYVEKSFILNSTTATSVMCGSNWGSMTGTIWYDDIKIVKTNDTAAVGFQIASSDSPNGPWDFRGPNGAYDTTGYYRTSGQAINPMHSGKRYIKYRVLFNYSNSVNAPAIGEVAISYSDAATRNFVIRTKDNSKMRFAASGALLSQTDPNNNTLTYARNASGNVSQIVDASGRNIVLEYNLGGRLCLIHYNNLIAKPDGTSGVKTINIAYSYDSNNLLSSVIFDPSNSGNPDGLDIVTTYGYLNNRLASITDPNGNTTTFTYDALGRLVSILDPLSKATTVAYEPEVLPATYWWNAAYGYRKQLMVENTSATEKLPAGFAVRVVVDTHSLVGENKAKSNGDDIMVIFKNLDGSYTELNRKIIAMDTAKSEIWFQTQSGIDSSCFDGNYWLYYGMPTANSPPADASKIFILFDDFDGTTIDTSKWDTTLAAATGFTVSGGQLHGTNTTGRLISKLQFTSPISQIVSTRTNSIATNGQILAGFYVSAADSFGLLQHPGNDHYRDDQVYVALVDPLPINEFMKITIDARSTSQVTYKIENSTGVTTKQETIANNILTDRVAFGKRYDDTFAGQAYSNDWDYVIIKQSFASEPVVSLSAQTGEQSYVQLRDSTAVITDPNNNKTVFTFAKFFNPETVTDIQGNTTNLFWDTRNNIVNKSTSRQSVVYEYDAGAGLTLANTTKIITTDKTNNTVSVNSIVYDANNNQLRTTDANGKSAVALYDEAGNLVNTTDGLGNSMILTYDIYGNVVGSTEPISSNSNLISNGSFEAGSTIINALVKIPGFTDDFSQGTAQWIIAGGTWQVENGLLSQSDMSAVDNHYLVSGSAGWTDYTVSAKCTLTTNGVSAESDILFRYLDSTNFYQVMVAAGNGREAGVYLYRKLGGSYTQLGVYRCDISFDTSYLVRVSVTGSLITVYLENAAVISLTDASISSGKVGLKSYATHSHFDDFTVALNGGATTTDNFAVDSARWIPDNTCNWQWVNSKIISGDFDGDGDIDTASFYNLGSNTVAVWGFLSGEKTSTPKMMWTSNPGSWDWNAAQVTAGDYNGDGKCDLAAMYNYGGATTRIWLFTSNGNKFVVSEAFYSTCWDASRFTLSSGDFDGDNKDEIGGFFRGDGTNSEIWILKLNGAAFTPSRAWASASWYGANSKFTTGDYTGDGKDDCAVLYDYGNASVRMWLFTSTGTAFTTSEAWYRPAGSWDWAASKLSSGDADGNGKCDITILYTYGGNTINLFLLKSNGTTFSETVAWTSSTGGWNGNDSVICGGDLDGDGKSDSAIFYNYGSGSMGYWTFKSNGLTLNNPVSWSTNWGQWVIEDGRISNPNGAGTLVAYAGQSDITMQAKVNIQSTSLTADGTPCVGLTGQRHPNGYDWRLVFTTFGGVKQLKLLEEGVAWRTGCNFNWLPNTDYWMKIYISGNTVSGKAWQVGTPEPLAWMVSAVFAYKSGLGKVGLTASGAHAYFDDVKVTPSPDNLKLRLDLVHEGDTWFSGAGSRQMDSIVSIGEYGAVYSAAPPKSLPIGATSFSVTATNTGTMTWNNTGTNKVRLAYWWFNPVTNAVVSQGAGTFDLPNDVAPGQAVAIPVTITAGTAGNYILKFGLEKVGTAWFHERGVPFFETYVNVAYQYGATYSANVPRSVLPGSKTIIRVTITNTGNWTWPSGTVNPVRLTYMWYNPVTNICVGGGDNRTALPHDVAPGQPVTLDVEVAAGTIGNYLLKFGLVHELVACFHDKGVPASSAYISVGAGLAADYVVDVPDSAVAGSILTIPVSITNIGTANWSPNGKNPVTLAYRWYDPTNNNMVNEGLRTYLNTDVPSAFAGWTVDTGNWVADSGVGKIGHESLKVTAINPADSYVRQEITVKPNTTYTISAWIKTENVVATTGRGTFLDVQDGTYVYLTTPLVGTHDWTRRCLTFTTSPTATTLKVYLQQGAYGAASGVSWFDGIELVEGQEMANYNLISNSGAEMDTQPADSNPDSWVWKVADGSTSAVWESNVFWANNNPNATGHALRQSHIITGRTTCWWQDTEAGSVTPGKAYSASAFIKTGGFRDDFTDGDSNGWTQNMGAWTLDSGEFSGDGGVDGGFVTAAGQVFGDLTASVKARFIASPANVTNWWGMTIHTSKPEDDYGKSGYLIYCRYDGDIGIWKNGIGTLSHAATGLDMTVKRDFKVVAVGNNLKIYVDGREYINYSDQTGSYTKGSISLNVCAGVHAHFDDFELIPPGGSGGARLVLQWLDQNGAQVGTDQITGYVQTKGDWRRVNVSAVAPVAAVRARVRLEQGDFAGETWFDIIRVEETSNVSVREYDAEGNYVIRSLDQLGHPTDLTYDRVGNVLTQTVYKTNQTTQISEPCVTKMYYDAAGRKVMIVTQPTSDNPSGSITTAIYDKVGNVIEMKDPNANAADAAHAIDANKPAGTPTAKHYNAANMVDWSANPLGIRTDFVYDNAGNMVMSVLDPVGLNRATTAIYDNLHRLLSTTSAGGNAEGTNRPAATYTVTTSADFLNGIKMNIDATTRPGDIVLAAGQTSGTYESPTYDAITAANWASITWNAATNTADGGTLAFTAANATVTTSTIRTINESGAGAFDGNLMSIWCPSTAGPQWIEIASPVAKSINKIVVYNHGNAIYTPRDYLIQTWDGSQWITQKTVTANTVCYPTPCIYTFSPVVTSRVRMYITAANGGTYPVVNEIQVFETESVNQSSETSVKFQVAVSDESTGPFNFIGPDGTSNTFYTTPWQKINAGSGRYIKFKAFLSTTVLGVSPILSDVSIYSAKTLYTTSFGYDDDGNRTTVTDARGTSTTVYDANNKPWKITDALGNTTYYSYDAAGNLIGTVAPGGDPMGTNVGLAVKGSTVSASYGGNLTCLNDGITTGYDGSNGFAYTQYNTDPPGYLILTLDKVYAISKLRMLLWDGDLGRFYRYKIETSLDGQNWRMFADRTSGEWRSWQDFTIEPMAMKYIRITGTYNSANSGLHVVELEAYTSTTTTIQSFDADNNLTSTTNPQGAESNYTYSEDGKKVFQTDANGNTTTYLFDEAGRMLSETDPLGNTTTFDYNEVGQNTKQTDPLGASTTSIFDQAGRLIQTINALNHVVENSYDPNGNLVEQINMRVNADSSITELSVSKTYDAAGHLISVTQHDGDNTYTTTYTYDAAGNVVRTQDPMGNITTRQYSPNNTVDLLTAALGTDVECSTRYSYDNRGNLITTVLDPTGLNQVTAFTYDANGKLLSVADPRAATSATPRKYMTYYTYDERGNRTSIVDAKGTTTYTYDLTNHLSSVTDPLGNTTYYTYDSIGNLVCSVDALRTITYTYDAENRMLSETTSTTAFLDTFKTFNTAAWTRTNDSVVFAEVNKQCMGLSANGAWIEMAGTSVFNRNQYPVFKTDFLFSQNNTGMHISVENAVTPATAGYRRLALLCDSGVISAQTYQDTVPTCVNATAVKQALINTWYTAEFVFSPVDAKVFVYEKGKTRPLAPAYTWTVNDWNPRFHFWNLRSKGFIDNTIVSVGPNQTTSYEYDAKGRKTAVMYYNGQREETTYDIDDRVTDVKNTSAPIWKDDYSVYNANNWTKPADTLVKWDQTGKQMVLNGSNVDFTAELYEKQTHPRLDDSLNFKTDFSFSAQGTSMHVATEGYAADRSYRRLAVLCQNGNFMIQTCDAAGTVYPIQPTITPQISAWYTVEFEFSKTASSVWLYLKGTAKPSTPTYTWSKADWDPRFHYWIYTGTGYIDNSIVTSYAAPDSTISYAYDTMDNLTYIKDETGRSFNLAYNAANRLATITDQNGNVVASYVYNANGNVTQETLAAGVIITDHVYDALNRQIGITSSKIGASLLSANYVYDDAGNRTQITEGLNGSTAVRNYVYDQANQLISVKDVNNAVLETYSYDESGNRTQAVTTAYGSTHYQYDAANQLTMKSTKVLLADNFSGHLTGAPDGWSASAGTWVAENEEVSGTVTASSFYISSKQGLQNIVYEANIKLISGNNAGIAFSSNTSGTNCYIFRASGSDGNMATLWKVVSGVSTLVASAPISIPAADTWYKTKVVVSGSIVECYYNDVLVITAAYVSNGKDNIGFYATSGHYHFDNVAVNTWVACTYDVNGNLINDGTYTYTWDAKDRLTAVRMAADGLLVASYTYDSEGKRTSKIVATSALIAQDNFDDHALGTTPDGWVARTNWTGSGVGTFASDGTMMQLTALNSNADVIRNPGLQDFIMEMDTKAVTINNWFGFVFGRDGNNAGAPSNNQSDGYLLMWTAAGALTLRRRGYDVASATLGMSINVLRHWKVVKSGGNIKIFYNNGATPVIEYNDLTPLTNTWMGFSIGSNATTNTAKFDNFKVSSYSMGQTNYSYNDRSDLLLTQTQGSSTITFITEPESYGDMIGMVKNGTTYYFLKNAHSDIVAVTDTLGRILTSWEYDAYGNPTEFVWNYDVNGNLTGKTAVSVGAFGNPYLYSSYYYDTETGMYYLSARYYDPEIGRFISRDPDGGDERDRLSMNPYAYCHNNPINGVDPDGHKKVVKQQKKQSFLQRARTYVQKRIVRPARRIVKRVVRNVTRTARAVVKTARAAGGAIRNGVKAAGSAIKDFGNHVAESATQKIVSAGLTIGKKAASLGSGVLGSMAQLGKSAEGLVAKLGKDSSSLIKVTGALDNGSSGLAKTASALGWAGVGLSVGIAVYDQVSNDWGNEKLSLGQVAARAGVAAILEGGGSVVGGLAGNAAGSWVGGLGGGASTAEIEGVGAAPGAVIGGIAGSVVGGMAGGYTGHIAKEWAFNQEWTKGALH